MHRSIVHGLSALSLCALAGSAQAAPEMTLGVFGAVIYDFVPDSDPANFVSNMRTLGGFQEFLCGLDYDADGDLWGLASSGGFDGFTLYNIDELDGTSVGTYTATTGFEGDLAYDPVTGGFLTIAGATSGDRFTHFDPDSGVNTRIATYPTGLTPFDDPSGIAVDGDGRIWVLETNTNGSDIAEMVEISRTDGSVISRTSLGIDLFLSAGMDWDPDTELLYFLGSRDEQLYSYDTSTSTLGLVDMALISGGVGAPSWAGLAIEKIPAPGAAGLLAIAGVVGVRRRR